MSKQAMNKEKWISLFRDIGLTDEDMKKWHHKFEERYPSEHQSFLEWLGITMDEIVKIRAL